jgi:hypothetical protein
MKKFILSMAILFPLVVWSQNINLPYILVRDSNSVDDKINYCSLNRLVRKLEIPAIYERVNLKSEMISKLLPDSMYSYSFKSPSDSFLSNIKYSSYSSKGELIRDSTATFDTAMLKWIPKSKNEYAFYTYGLSSMSLGYSWNKTSGKWDYYSRTDYFRDQNGNDTLYLYSRWNFASNTWLNQSIDQSIYDAHNNISSRISCSWYKTYNKWDTLYKQDYTYNTDGKQILLSLYDWNSASNQWLLSLKCETFYDANGYDTLYTNNSWDSYSGKWILTRNEHYYYNENGKDTLIIILDWVSDKWVNSGKYEYKFNAAGYITSFANYTWNATKNKWTGLFNYGYSYDSNHNLSQRYNYGWNSGTDSWTLTSKDTYFSSIHFLNGMKIHSLESDMKIYPNPVSDYLNIEKSDNNVLPVMIYDMNGNLMLNESVTGNEINVQSLSPGIYILKVDESIFKLIKQ